MVTQRSRRDLTNELDRLLGDLCREWGFCNRLTAEELLGSGGALSDAQFAHAVLRAENMNPEYEPDWTRKIRERFAARFGPSISISD